MRALVTGGTGFIGSHVARTLMENGHQVRVLHRPDSKLTALDGLDFESAIGGLSDVAALRAACEGIDWVFHVAAVADYWRADKSAMFAANVDGTRNVLAAAREAGVKRVIFTSSAATVGIRADGQPADENEPFNLQPDAMPYGYSKVLAERIAQEAVQQGQDVVTVNPVVVMGPGDLNMISGSFIVQMAKIGRWIPITSGGIALVDVRDVARWQVAAAEKGRTGERYLLATVNYHYEEFLGLLASVMDVPKPFLRLPDFVVNPIGGLNELLHRVGIQTPVDGDQIRLSTRSVFFDGAKAWREFGTPLYAPRETLRDTFVWYRDNGYLDR